MSDNIENKITVCAQMISSIYVGKNVKRKIRSPNQVFRWPLYLSEGICVDFSVGVTCCHQISNQKTIYTISNSKYVGIVGVLNKVCFY